MKSRLAVSFAALGPLALALGCQASPVGQPNSKMVVICELDGKPIMAVKPPDRVVEIARSAGLNVDANANGDDIVHGDVKVRIGRTLERLREEDESMARLEVQLYLLATSYCNDGLSKAAYQRLVERAHAGGLEVALASEIQSEVDQVPVASKQATEEEPNDDRSAASRMRVDGTARGDVDGTEDRIDLWTFQPEVTGMLTLFASTTGGEKGARINKVTVFAGATKVSGGSQKPFKLGNRVSFGPFRVKAGEPYFVEVEGAPRGRFAEYLLETNFEAKP